MALSVSVGKFSRLALSLNKSVYNVVVAAQIINHKLLIQVNAIYRCKEMFI